MSSSPDNRDGFSPLALRSDNPLCCLLWICATLLIPIGIAACSSSSEDEIDDDMQEFIGSPPEEEDDPMFKHALPAEAVPADPSGRVGAVDDEPEESDEDQEPDELAIDDPDEPEESDEDEELVIDDPDEPEEADEDEEPAESDELAAAEPDPVERPEDISPPPDIPDDRPACFSCVRICPVDDSGNADCPAGSDDLICGWGSHEDDRSQARNVAQAQCESSLDLARHMPNYDGIDGQCPPATCR